jgi:arylsulfatase A-like enzyme
MKNIEGLRVLSQQLREDNFEGILENMRKNTPEYRNFYILLLFICLFSSCQGKRSENSVFLKKKDNIVVILVDTLRADHLPSYGYGIDTAPYLTQLAERGVIFNRAFSAASFTAPAIASIFTSLYPSEHGVITGFVATQRHATENGRLPINRISDSVKTLPQVFREAGYKTFGVSDNFNIVEAQGFTKGFDQFKNFPDRGSEVLNDTLRAWKSEMERGDKPYFLYLHYMEPHSPYREHAPWYSTGKTPDENHIRAYDSEIRFLDDQIKKISEEFDWEENALVVLVADHGEEFLEHGNRGHGKTLYTEVLHVPFVFFHRSLPAQRVSKDVQTMDLLPTLADEIGYQKLKNWRGLSLQAVLAGNAEPAQREIFSELLRRPEHPRDPKRSVIFDDHHLIHDWDRKGGSTHELYDLQADFTEKTNIASSATGTLAKGKAELEDFEQGNVSHSEESSIEVDAEAMEQLKSLGYLE